MGFGGREGDPVKPAPWPAADRPLDMVRTQIIEERIDLQVDEVTHTLLVGVLKPAERLIRLTAYARA